MTLKLPVPPDPLVPLCHAMNHLLAQDTRAQQKLQVHRGKTAAVDLGLLALRLRVTADGFVETVRPLKVDVYSEAASAHGDGADETNQINNVAKISEAADAAKIPEVAVVSDVTIRIKLSDLPLLAANSDRAFSYVKIEGDADFANAISQVGQSLRWDAGHDLSRLFGDVVAQRMVSGAAAAIETVKATHRSFTENLAEYFLEENPMLVRPSAVSDMGGDVGKLRDDIERLAKRVEKLEGKR